MKYVYIYCEGQTEEAFVNDILYPYFSRIGIYVQPIIHKTKRTPTKSFRGGVSKYEPIKREFDGKIKRENLSSMWYNEISKQTLTKRKDRFSWKNY